MRHVLHVPAGAGGVKAVDQVGSINVGERLRGEDSHTARAAEMVHQVSLSSITTENVGNFGSSSTCK